MTVWSAIVKVPVLCDIEGFSAKLSVTDPFPLPEEPLVTVIQAVFDAAVQAQPAVEDTEMVVLLAPEGTDSCVVLNWKLQARPACVTVTVCPAMVTVPFRWLLVGLASKLRETVPFPEPDAPPVTAIQPA